MPNQISLGILLGTFSFCLIVLRSVRSGGDGQFVPHTAALLAFVGSIGSLMTFIYFIHHIATSLQADEVVAGVYEELDTALGDHFPDRLPDGSDEREADGEKRDWEDTDDEIEIGARKSGCIQAIAVDKLVEQASRLDLRCRVLRRPGQFINEESALLAVHGAGVGALEESERDDLIDTFIIDRMRTAEQDFEYCLRQLVEVSLRALSPGINDPFTAMNCIDFLGAALAKVAQRKLPERQFSDADGILRVQTRPTTFADLLDAAFNQIRQTAGGRTDVSLRLLGALAGIGANLQVDLHRESVVKHAEMVAEAGRRGAQADADRAAIDAALVRVYERLNMPAKCS